MDGSTSEVLVELAGFGVSGYRSFGPEGIQRVGPMSKVHMLVGRNNVGKSNALRVVHDVLQRLRGTQSIDLSVLFPEPLDTPDNWPPNTSRFVSVAFHRSEEFDSRFGLDRDQSGFLEALLACNAFTLGDPNVAWFDFELVTLPHSPGTVSIQPRQGQLDEALEQIATGYAIGHLQALSMRLLSQSSGNPYADYAAIIQSRSLMDLVPQVAWVDAIREITTERSDGQIGFNGRGLITDLAQWANPEFEQHAVHTARFEALQAFVRSVLGDDDARLQIPRSETTMLVHTRGGNVKPFDKMGTGIGEVILIAAVATGTSDQLICIEEPEVHLHPTLQQKLIDYLVQNTTNNYLVSTHSASLVNSDLASVTHLTNDGWTRATAVLSRSTQASAVFELGNRASDLVQSNFVIWVEGPSDRILIKAWLGLRAPDLVEGAHFSIMFYGGALLRHLAVDDADTDEFVDLLAINRHLAVVIDSDRAGESESLNATKLRVIAEVEAVGGIAWVTDGYTIENYVTIDCLQAAIAEKYPGRTYEVPNSKWMSPLGSRFEGTGSKPNKVLIARAITAEAFPVEDWPQGLRERIDSLVESIVQANRSR